MIVPAAKKTAVAIAMDRPNSTSVTSSSTLVSVRQSSIVPMIASRFDTFTTHGF